MTTTRNPVGILLPAALIALSLVGAYLGLYPNEGRTLLSSLDTATEALLGWFDNLP